VSRPELCGWLCSLLLCVAVVVAWGAARIPLPGVNEPHYLGKSLHFWNPAWCAGDFFLESANAHWFFYAAFGWLTLPCDLPTVAVVGRGLAWISFGVAWSVWFRAAARSPNHAPAAIAAVLAISAIGSLSGEWLVGGIESKCFAYPALLLGLHALGTERPLWAAAWFGLATSWHPLVGGWGVLAVLAVLAVGCCRLASDRVRNASLAVSLSKAVGVFAITAAPGLIPSIWMLAAAPSRDVSSEANVIQFTHRLAHHLDPRQFHPAGWWLYGGLILVWGLARSITPRNTVTATARWFDAVTVVACLIAVGATVLAWLNPIPGVLKFYPFRMADAFVPIAASLAVSDAVSPWAGRRRVADGPTTLRYRAPGFVFAAVVALAYGRGLMNPVPDYDGEIGSRFTPRMRAGLIDAASWIRSSTPAGSVVTTPRFVRGFKWWGHRAEFVSHKDCPQDAAGIVEWRRRILAWESFLNSALADNRVTLEEGRRFANRERVDFWLAGNWLPPIDLPLLYRNEHFSVYAWPPRGDTPP
jgi:hypothetical protein